MNYQTSKPVWRKESIAGATSANQQGTMVIYDDEADTYYLLNFNSFITVSTQIDDAG